MKILVIRFSSLGDCILLCPLLDYLKRAGAEEIVVLTKRAYAGIFSATRGVDRVVAMYSSAGAATLWRMAGKFRDKDYHVIDAHASARSRLLCWRMGRVDARIEKHTRERLELIFFKKDTELPTMLERYAKLCAPLGIETPQLAPGGLRLSADSMRTAELAMGARSFIAVAPGSRWPSKRWHGFARLCDQLARDHSLLLVGDGADRAVIRPIVQALGNRCLDIAGRSRLMDTAAHIARCRVFVGNDSGLMHLAEAVGVPVVSLFGPTVESFGYYPSLALSRTVERRIACRPCSKNGSVPCPRGTVECLAAIEPETVAHAVATIFDPAAPRRIVLD